MSKTQKQEVCPVSSIVLLLTLMGQNMVFWVYFRISSTLKAYQLIIHSLD